MKTSTPIRRWLSLLRQQIRDYRLSGSVERFRIFLRRSRFERFLDRQARRLHLPALLPAGSPVLVDGIWDNPNYWTRYAQVRAALGLCDAHEIGLVGPFSRRDVARCFGRQGITRTLDLAAFETQANALDYDAVIADLMAETHSADDVLNWRLPHGVPASLLYDSLLKWQQLGAVDVSRPDFPKHVRRGLVIIEAIKRLMEANKFSLVILSHCIGIRYGTIAALATEACIPVMVLYGDFGTWRFIRLRTQADLFRGIGMPTVAEAASIDDSKRSAMIATGKQQLDLRFKGKSSDLGAAIAYRRADMKVDRTLIASALGWDPERPIVALYAQNWFDYPRNLGIKNFRDFHDWVSTTLAVASKNPSVNWLIKGHPVDYRYNIERPASVEGMVESVACPHIQMADRAWNNLSVMQAVDGGITCNGSVGFEMTALGKPVLTAERPWYGFLDFVKCSHDRQEYLDALQRRWWEEHDTAAAQRKAWEFAAWHYGVPGWQDGCVYGDDPTQSGLYEGTLSLLAEKEHVVRREVAEIRQWWLSGHQDYHPYKLILAEDIVIGNVELT